MKKSYSRNSSFNFKQLTTQDCTENGGNGVAGEGPKLHGTQNEQQ